MHAIPEIGHQVRGYLSLCGNLLAQSEGLRPQPVQGRGEVCLREPEIFLALRLLYSFLNLTQSRLGIRILHLRVSREGDQDPDDVVQFADRPVDGLPCITLVVLNQFARRRGGGDHRRRTWIVLEVLNESGYSLPERFIERAYPLGRVSANRFENFAGQSLPGGQEYEAVHVGFHVITIPNPEPNDSYFQRT